MPANVESLLAQRFPDVCGRGQFLTRTSPRRARECAGTSHVPTTVGGHASAGSSPWYRGDGAATAPRAPRDNAAPREADQNPIVQARPFDVARPNGLASVKPIDCEVSVSPTSSGLLGMPNERTPLPAATGKVSEFRLPFV